MRLTLARADVLDALADLRRIYGDPKGGDPEDVARVWLDGLQGVAPEELRDAVRECIRTEARYWPRPALIRRMVAEARHGKSITGAATHRIVCGGCGALIIGPVLPCHCTARLKLQT